MTNKNNETRAEKKVFKIVCVGDSNTWTNAACSKNELTYNRNQQITVGVVTTATDAIKIDYYEVKFQIWDISVQESFAPLRTSFYTGANGAIIAFSATEQDSINNLESWVQELRENINDIPIVLVNYLHDIGEKKAIADGDAITKKLAEKINVILPIFEHSKKEIYKLDEILITLGKMIIGIP